MRKRLGSAPRAGLLSGAGRVEPYSRHPGRFLYQVARELRAFPRHHGTRSQRETQRIRLIFKIENDLSRHSDFSRWARSAGPERSSYDEGGIERRLVPPIL